jgi:hypothetical protein
LILGGKVEASVERIFHLRFVIGKVEAGGKVAVGQLLRENAVVTNMEHRDSNINRTGGPITSIKRALRNLAVGQLFERILFMIGKDKIRGKVAQSAGGQPHQSNNRRPSAIKQRHQQHQSNERYNHQSNGRINHINQTGGSTGRIKPWIKQADSHPNQTGQTLINQTNGTALTNQSNGTYP